MKRDSDGQVKPRQKRFKHQSYQAAVKQIHLPSPLTRNVVDTDISDNESHFRVAIDDWRQSNLSPIFLKFATKAEPLAMSMVILLHNAPELVGLWMEAVKEADDEALQPLLDLLEKLLHDLRSTLAPQYEQLLAVLLPLSAKSLGPEVLPVYLQTVSTLFKYLLLPQPDFLPSTWTSVQSALRSCTLEMQRMLGEVVGTIIRKLKLEDRLQMVQLLVDEQGDLENAIAWIFVSATQSVSNTLHTTALSFVTALLDRHLVAESNERTFKLLRRVLASAMHHSTIESFAPIAEALVLRAEETKAAENEEKLARVLEVLCLVCAFKKGNKSGSMLDAKQATSILNVVTTTPLSPRLRQPVLHVAVACLKGYDMAIWMKGRRAIDRIWEDILLGYSLAAVLSSLDQSKSTTWKDFVLPSVLRTVPAQFKMFPKETLGLLRSLNSEDRLTTTGTKWKNELGDLVREYLFAWVLNEEWIITLQDVFPLDTVFPGLEQNLIPIVETIFSAQLDVQAAQEEYARTAANSAWCLGECLVALSKVEKGWKKVQYVDRWIRLGLERYPWSSKVVGGLAALAKFSTQRFTFDDAFEFLKAAILSYSHTLRLSALHFLLSPAVERTPAQDSATRACLQAEETPLTAQSTPERILKTSRVGLVCPLGEGTAATGVCVRWLTAQLKVNLMPIWKPAATAIAGIAQRAGGGEEVWPVIFSELALVSQGERSSCEVVVPSWSNSLQHGNSHDEKWQEEEKTWRNPGYRESLLSLQMKGLPSALKKLVETQSPNERLDIPNYETQLIRTLESCTSLAERHNRDLVPLFLAFASPDLPQRPQRQKLVSWLSLFAKFRNPRAAHSTLVLQQLYTSLLSHPDRQLQNLAVDCTLTYKSQALLAHEKTIRSLLDQSEWKERVVSLKLAETVQPDERAEVVELLIRLFFGMMRERKGRNQIHGKRGALLRFLGQCSEQELGVLVDLMIEPFKFSTVPDVDIPSLAVGVTDKQQTGFLVLLADVLRYIGSNLTIWWPKLLKATMAIVLNAQEMLDKAMELDVEDAEEVETAGLEEQDELTAGAPLPHKVARNIRQLGLKRLVEFFRSQVTFDFRPYLPAAFRGIISPRLPALDRENTQAPSTLLELFHVWSSNPSMRLFLVDYDDRLLPKVYQCLTAPSVKRPVVSRVFDIVEQILDGATDNEEIASRVAKPHMAVLLDHLTIMVENTARTGVVTSELSQRQIRILSSVAGYVSDASQASRLVHLLSPLLRKSTRIVAEKLKVDLLYIIQQLLPLLPQMTDATDATSVKTYDLLAYLFQTLRTRQSRLALVSAFNQLANYDSSLQRVAPLIESLNSYAERRHEEPDFERRLQAFASLNEQLHGQLSPREWFPLIYNMLFFIHEPEEVAIRNNAAYTLRRFINVVASKSLPDCETAFNRVLWPGLKNGMRVRNDMVRGDILGVLGYAVAHCDHLASLREMSVLLANGDEEANFFNNVHHIQVHRRTRALRRLAEYCEQGCIRSGALADIFLPLISHLIGDSSIDHTLVNEAITTTGKIARYLAWGPYYALVQLYLRNAKEKNSNEKTYVRAMVCVLDNFHFAMADVVQQPVEEVGASVEEETDLVPSIPTRIADAVTSRLLPSLLTYLEKRDETEDEVRILVSTGVVRVALHLPEETRQPQISRLLTILSQALRSKSQDTRNLVRETLCKIAMILGPEWLHPLIKELRLALTRGPQLHVLAYTCHSILVHVTDEPSNAFSHLDDAAEDVAEVSAEVIFGQSGRDAQGEDFKTTMKEVRGAASKALDSFALIAKHIAPRSITRLLIPLRSVMHETEVLKVMNQVEDILRRITTGLNSNLHLTPPELLVLCHSLISQNARFLQEAPRIVERRVKGGKKQFIVQTKRDLPTTREHYAHNSFRFVAFGLDLIVTAFRRGKFNFQDEGIIARLEPMVPIIGNTLYSTSAPVVILGLKAAAAILKAPLKAARPAVSVVCSQCIQIVRQAGGTESETAQTALKSLAIILRDCSTAELKETDLGFLLEAMSPDLEEPERQAAVFALLRALVVRKFVVPEIYDMMEQLAGVMVTSQSPQVQELCRSVLLQFLLDYPQGKGRLRKQMTFLASNLSYIFESGRQSVMELLGAVLTKFDSALIKEYGELFWVALVMVLANDDSAKCRERAAELIKSLYRALDDMERRKLLDRTHVWAQQAGKILTAPEGKEAVLARVAAQLYGLMTEVLEQGMGPYMSVVMEDLNFMTAVSARLFASIAECEEEDRMEDDLEWRLGYYALTVLSKLAKYFPELLSSDPGTETPMDWASVVRLMLFPHSWVRIASSRLLGSLYATLPTTTTSFSQDHSHPAAIPGMVLVAQNSCIQLKSEHADEALVLQVVKNLAWLGRAFSVLSPRLTQHPDDSSSEREAGGDDDGDNGDIPAGDERVNGLKKAERSPLPWLFSKLSYQIKTALIQRRSSFSARSNWYHQPSAILRWFAAMVSHLDPILLERYLIHILTPVYRVIDDDSIHDTHIGDLKALSQELQDLVQAKIGTTVFAAAYNQIRQGALSVRRERKAARAILVTTNPEAAARRQIHRNISKKENRKRKSRSISDARVQGSTFKRRKMG